MVLGKSRIAINKDKHLGDLLLLRLHRGDHSLKFSFKNKVGPELRKLGPVTGTFKDIDFTKPNLYKEIPQGVSLEISYIFEKGKLEIKQEVAGDEIARNFYDVTMPIENFLFAIIVRNIENLQDIEENPENLILNTDNLGDQVAICFSFEGINGKPFVDPFSDPIEGMGARHITWSMPEVILDKLHILVTRDNNPLPESSEILLSVPHKPTKIS